MKGAFSSFKVVACIGILLLIIASACNQAETKQVSKNTVADSLAIRKTVPPSPVLSPQASMKKMHLQKGFAVKLVAAEPLLSAPVALSFDERGRMWVVEMQDYMPDTLGTGEENPTGKVVILSDKNGDGVMDDRKIFLDSLLLPRAICLIEDGILVAEPPKLWYYQIKGDRPVKKTLVDSTYAKGGNVEHQSNGLFRALDNWIYSAKSDKRYRKQGNRWLMERTHFRGQWGITQDDYGRLYYNTNSENLLGDYFSPGLGAYNKNQQSEAGYIKAIVEDNRVYPVRPTPGVNRGYMEGVLDDSLRLVNFTAACGPVIYNGGLFDQAYNGNAFVAEPSANLIKRNILSERGYKVEGKEAYAGEEFLASEDERFRPVSLYTGPDGAMYIVDIYRGIIQHKTYLTTYLKNEIRDRNLTKPLSCGRIYKIVPQNRNGAAVTFSNDPNELVKLLSHPNGWVRNKAQQLLIDGKYKQAVPQLQEFLKNSDQPLTVIHALWTLEGFGALKASDVQSLLKEKTGSVRVQGLSVIPSIISRKNYKIFLSSLQQIGVQNDTLALPYVAYLVHYLQPYDNAAAHQLLVTLTKNHGSNLYVADAIISNLQKKETAYYKEALQLNPDTSWTFNKRLKKVIEDIGKAKNNSNAEAVAKQFPRGATLFQSVCQTCHGANGNGVPALAPPLNNSDWVMGDKNKLIPIVLYGLSGPVQVSGKIYKAPEINGDMPAIGQNKEFSDDDIAQVLSYIRASWSNKAAKIRAVDVTNTRSKFQGRQKTFTMEELKSLK